MTEQPPKENMDVPPSLYYLPPHSGRLYELNSEIDPDSRREAFFRGLIRAAYVSLGAVVLGMVLQLTGLPPFPAMILGFAPLIWYAVYLRWLGFIIGTSAFATIACLMAFFGFMS